MRVHLAIARGLISPNGASAVRRSAGMEWFRDKILAAKSTAQRPLVLARSLCSGLATMRRLTPLFLLSAALSVGQSPVPIAGAPLQFTGTVSLPLNGRQMLGHAAEAWRYSFGLEPGAHMEIDTATNRIVGTARFNFRSGILLGREETQGPIAYRLRLTILNGECRWTVDDLKHAGNRGAPNGGKDLGLLTTEPRPLRALPGMSITATIKVWEDAKVQVAERIDNVRRVFEARLRLLADQ